MSDSYFVSGLVANACVQAWGVTVADEHTLTDFQKAKLQNGRPWEIFIAGTPPSADWNVIFDNNIVPNADFELDNNGETPTSWTVESGAPTVSTDQSHTGSKSLKLNATDEEASVKIKAIMGKKYRVEVALWGDGTGNIEFYLIDTVTGKYKTSASETSWTATETALFTRSTASFAVSTQTFVIDSPTGGSGGVTDLKIRIKQASGVGAAYADLAIVYPEIDFASLHYMNVPDSIAIEIWSADDLAFTTNDVLEDTIPVQRWRSFVKFTPDSSTPKRWWRFLFSGTAFDPIRLGQPVLASATTVNSAQEVTRGNRSMPLVGSALRPTPKSPESIYSYNLEFISAVTEYATFVEELYGPCKSAEPVIFVIDANQTVRYPVMHGMLSPRHAWSRTGDLYTHRVIFTEDPFVVSVT